MQFLSWKPCVAIEDSAASPLHLAAQDLRWAAMLSPLGRRVLAEAADALRTGRKPEGEALGMTIDRLTTEVRDLRSGERVRRAGWLRSDTQHAANLRLAANLEQVLRWLAEDAPQSAA